MENVQSAACSRRAFVRATGLGALGLAALGVTAGCSPQGEEQLSETGSGDSWDGEFDFVVAGSGTALIGALTAAKNGASVAVVEKGAQLGGTTRLSGAGAWVPKNKHQVDEGLGEDLPDEEILGYMEACDIYGGSSRETKEDYLAHAASVFEWLEENLGMRMAVAGGGGDYTSLPGAKPLGRSISPIDANGEGIVGEQLFADTLIPLVDELGVQNYLDAEAQQLVVDENGTVAGLIVKSGKDTLRLKANKGVLLGTGGFERDQVMREAFIKGPVYGALSVEGNTGDGHKMAVAIGAGLQNMESLWHCPFYVTAGSDGSDMSETVTDWGDYGGLPGAILVNRFGRRFTDESSGYAWSGFPFTAFDAKTCSLANVPAYLIFDATHVELCGWPNSEEAQPEWVSEYATLDELAAACGIDAAGLASEVERFNKFCVTGKDEDFDRGKSNYSSMLQYYLAEIPDAPNPLLGAIATPPFYAAQMGPGTLGTCGGLNVDGNAQVLDTAGKPIEGLYACGNTAANVFGSAYPGATATTGQGYYRAFRAANHALGLGLIEA